MTLYKIQINIRKKIIKMEFSNLTWNVSALTLWRHVFDLLNKYYFPSTDVFKELCRIIYSVLMSPPLSLQRVKSGRDGSARGRRGSREGSASSAGESVSVCHVRVALTRKPNFIIVQVHLIFSLFISVTTSFSPLTHAAGKSPHPSSPLLRRPASRVYLDTRHWLVLEGFFFSSKFNFTI